MANLITRPLLKLVAKLRFPYLFALSALLLIVDLLVPDPIPLLDEIVLGLLTLLFGAWRRRKQPDEQ